MFTNTEAVCEFVRRYNGIATGKANDFMVKDIMAAINRAYRNRVKQLTCLEDQNREIRNHLRHLLVTHDVKKPMTVKKVSKDVSEIVVPSDYYVPSKVFIEAKHECCEDDKGQPIPKLIEVKLYQSDEVGNVRNNPYRKADFRWNQLPGDESKDGIHIYHDGAMEICNAYVDYYKKVETIPTPDLGQCDGKFKNWSGRNEEKANGQIPCDTYLFDDIIDEAVMQSAIAARDYTFGAQKVGEININRN